ncbi:MAG TPA: FeoB-associated Cys-rich membrane protein [Deltaproteobacteria bacterium]|nr:FeoB-associated Cys-rich membrane protein [Deltaproteobacteria bacterium]HBG72486.1 FeoB-associated Cys-rich membrane protein [Deltaproteobacteria bacterium]
MGIVDFVLIGLIVGGAFYLLYRSLWKKKGYCHGCDSAGKCK